MGRKLIKNPILFLVLLAFVFFVITPLAYTIGTTLISVNLLSNVLLLLNIDTLLLLGKSVVISFSIALLSTLAGTLLGFITYKTNTKYKSFFKIILLLPLFISPYILAVAWKDFFYLLFNNTGVVSSYYGVIIVLTTIFTPLPMLITGNALSNINAQLEEVGLLTTSRFRVIVSITLPLIKPAIISSFILVFVFSISEFSVPAFFGVKVITTEIFTQFSAFYNHSLAILQSTLLVTICIVMLFSERKYLANAPFLSVGDRGTKQFFFKSITSVNLIILFGWLLLSVLIPIITLLVQSTINGTEKLVQAFDLLIPTMSNSIWLAIMGAIIIVIIGFAAAIFSTSKKLIRVGNMFNALLLLTFAIPSTVLGISLIKFYNQPGLDIIYSSFAIILIGYVGKFSFISAKLIENAIKRIPKSLDESAQIIGITYTNRLRSILLPLITPTLFIAFLISFIFSIGELGTTIMLYPPGTEIMPIKVFTIMANAPQSLTSSMALIVFSVTLLLIIGFYISANYLINKTNVYDD